MNKTVLGILHSSHLVPLGSPIWETESELQKYVKIIETTINECADRAETYAYMSPNFTALAEELRAILRKAQSNCNGFCGEYECKENQAHCKRKAQE